jgi:hypothetical protein
MSDIAGKMAEWRKTVWGTGPCQFSSQQTLTLTDEEREAVEWAASCASDREHPAEATLRSLLDRTETGGNVK